MVEWSRPGDAGEVAARTVCVVRRTTEEDMSGMEPINGTAFMITRSHGDRFYLSAAEGLSEAELVEMARSILLAHAKAKLEEMGLSKPNSECPDCKSHEGFSQDANTLVWERVDAFCPDCGLPLEVP